MKKAIVTLSLLILTAGQSFAYVEKVYDEYGERVGSARKVGDSYEWYDMDNKRVKSYKDLANGAEVFVGSLPARPADFYYSYYYWDPIDRIRSNRFNSGRVKYIRTLNTKPGVPAAETGSNGMAEKAQN